MYTYGVGQVVENFKYHSEEVQFDIADDGATMLVFFQNPTAKEIEQFKSGKNFEIRFTELYGVIMITVKIGNLNWMDAPYTPHLSKNLTKIPLLSENQGLALTLILVDAIIGKIQHIRLLGLSNRFTEKLFSVVKEHKEKPFDLAEYNQSLNRIFSTYPTSKIIKMSTDYCKIND
jgi:hypothetical protein